MAIKPKVPPMDPPAPGTIKDETTAASASSTVEADDPTPASQPFTEGAADTESDPRSMPATSPGTAVAAPGTGPTSARFASLHGELKFGSFPQVKLDKDKFEVAEEGTLEEFYFNPLQARKRWIYKSKNKEEIFFSYDQKVATDGIAVDQKIANWKADGDVLKEVREYQEVAGRVYGGEFDGRMVILSVPPTSVGRLSGVQAELGMMNPPVELDMVLLLIKAGAKITTAAKKTYHPWAFRYFCMVDQWDSKKPAEKA